MLNHEGTKKLLPFIGEDIKVMGVRNLSQNMFTISIAIVDRYIQHVKDYESKINLIKKFIADRLDILPSKIFINTADDYQQESLFLTVTGTSAEAGDDGQVGRGNRINGLITPYQPMSLEAIAGKNPVSHVGKIYNQLAMEMSRSIVKNQFAEVAQVFIVSQIGKPIDEPQILHIRLNHAHVDKAVIERHAIVQLKALSEFWKRYINFNA